MWYNHGAMANLPCQWCGRTVNCRHRDAARRIDKQLVNWSKNTPESEKRPCTDLELTHWKVAIDHLISEGKDLLDIIGPALADVDNGP